METLTNAYKYLNQKSKLFKTNSIATGTKELVQRKIYAKKHTFFYKMTFLKVLADTFLAHFCLDRCD